MVNDVADKTLYDGRLLTHQRLHNALTMYANSLNENDLNGCINALNIVLMNSVGALTNASIEKYKNKLLILKNKVNMLNNGSKVNPNNLNITSISNDLNNISLELMLETKNLYLPYQDVDNDPDELFEKIKKQSG